MSHDPADRPQHAHTGPGATSRGLVHERLERRLAELPLSETARAHVERELEHLRDAPPGSPDASRIRNHLEWVLELPFGRRAEPPVCEDRFAHVARVLDRRHVGLADVKERVAEFLAVRQLGGTARGSVLCLQGPPGTGKTSFGHAIAHALGRPVVTIPVGAMTYERELVGVSHRHSNGQPGAILAGIHRAGVSNPVVILDEIDKLHLGSEGNSAGALQQILDREQNAEFVDHYLGVPFDLSDCLFLATADDLEESAEQLQDRLEVVQFDGYTEREKIEIARAHLLPRARAFAGIRKSQLVVTPAALRTILQSYTEEAGVRTLQRQLFALARKAAVRVVRGEQGLRVRKADLPALLGPATVDEELRLRRPSIGCVTGLAWTSAGGALLPIEMLRMPGQGRTILTGQVGEILRESVQTAISWLRTRFRWLGLAEDHLDGCDLHVHFPSAATPKDGPSAGVAIATALVSVLTRIPARHDVALTGEVSLRGTVLPVGGIREKALAAIRARIPVLIVPEGNAQEVLRLPPEMRNQLTIHLVEHVQEAIALTLRLPESNAPVPRSDSTSPGSIPGRRAARGARAADRGGD